MNKYNKKQVFAIRKKNEQKLLEVNPDLDNGSGIYFLTMVQPRAYIGQSVHIRQRLCEHMDLGAHQYIDLSLKKHKLFDAKTNPYGYKVGFLHYPKEELDKWEQYWIKEYADAGYELLNKTSGGQGEGKEKIADFRPAKGYRDGLSQGRKNLARELKDIITKHLTITIQAGKENNKISQRMYQKFFDLLNEEDEKI